MLENRILKINFNFYENSKILFVKTQKAQPALLSLAAKSFATSSTMHDEALAHGTIKPFCTHLHYATVLVFYIVGLWFKPR